MCSSTLMQVFMRLTALVKSGEAAKMGIGATEAARALGMAPALAKEQLLAAESRGLFFSIQLGLGRKLRFGSSVIEVSNFCMGIMLVRTF